MHKVLGFGANGCNVEHPLVSPAHCMLLPPCAVTVMELRLVGRMRVGDTGVSN